MRRRGSSTASEHWLTAYIAEPRARAVQRRSEGLEQTATLYELVASEIEAAHAAWLHEALSMQLAAAESGYSIDNMKLLVRTGRVPNAGNPGTPRVRRGDLPRKPGHGVAWRPGPAAVGQRQGGEPDLTQIAFGNGDQHARRPSGKLPARTPAKKDRRS